MIGVGKKLGELLIEDSHISELQLEQAISHQKIRGARIGETLVDLGFARTWQINEALSKQVGIETVDLSKMNVSQDVISKVPAELVSKHKIFPFAFKDNRILIAMNDPFNPRILEELNIICPFGVRRYYAPKRPIRRSHFEILRQ